MNNKEFRKMVIYGCILTCAMSAAGLFVHPLAALLCACTGTGLTGIFAFYTKKRYDCLQELNTYLSRVLSGDYDLRLSENEEGELSLLRNNLYKVTVVLCTQNEKLGEDKVYLANSLADISHQLKTPLTSMMMMADLLAEEEDSSRRQQFIKIMETQLEKMNWLIQNLLKLSKLDAETVELKDIPVSAREVLSRSVNPFLVQMDLKGLHLKDEMADFQFRGDPGWSCEAFENIIKNCLEHMEEGGTLRLYTKQTTLYDSVFIQDDGCGILPEDLPHIFERFYHGKNASEGSVGIGLALAKTIVEKQRGQILVESREGVGTVFEIRFYKSIV